MKSTAEENDAPRKQTSKIKTRIFLSAKTFAFFRSKLSAVLSRTVLKCCQHKTKGGETKQEHVSSKCFNRLAARLTSGPWRAVLKCTAS